MKKLTEKKRSICMMIDFKKQGKKNRASGKAFEIRVRKDLESKGWIVCKWTNNVEFERSSWNDSPEIKEFAGKNVLITKGKLIPAKAQYNPFFKRIVGEGSGFPDFIAFRNWVGDVRNPESVEELRKCHEGFYKKIVIDAILMDNQYDFKIIGVECKINGYLTKEEKDKCNWLLDNKIFSKILIASKGKKRGNIEYEEYAVV